MPGSVSMEVELDGVAEEGSVEEYARASLGVARVVAQLDALTDQLGTDLEQAAAKAHRAVLAHLAPGTVQEDLIEVDAAGQWPQLAGLGKPVLSWRPLGRGVAARVVLGTEPGPGDGVELGQRDRSLTQLVADLLAPAAVPPFNGSFRLTISGGGVHQVNAQLGTDHAQRAGDVGRAEIDVVSARPPGLQESLLQSVLVLDGTLAKGEVAVDDVASGGVDLGKQVGLS